MSGFALRLSLDDTPAAAAAGRLKALGANMRAEIFEPAAGALETTTLERFDTGLGPDGEAWVPSGRVLRTGGKTLVEHGHFRDSFHGEAFDDAAEVGSAHVSAGAHQFGAVISAKGDGRLGFVLAGVGFRAPKSVRLPARPIVGFSAEDAANIGRIGEEALGRAVGGAA